MDYGFTQSFADQIDERIDLERMLNGIDECDFIIVFLWAHGSDFAEIATRLNIDETDAKYLFDHAIKQMKGMFK